VEDEEALQTGTIVGQTTHLLEHIVDELLANGVVATSVFRQLEPDLYEDPQLLAASSFPVIMVSGWNKLR
jgi:hypothetical protein